MEYTYKYPRPTVTADCVVMRREAEPKVLFIQRGDQPFKGGWAFPGGFMNMDLTSLSLMNLWLSLAKMMPPKPSGGHYQTYLIWHLTTMTLCRMPSESIRRLQNEEVQIYHLRCNCSAFNGGM